MDKSTYIFHLTSKNALVFMAKKNKIKNMERYITYARLRQTHKYPTTTSFFVYVM